MVETLPSSREEVPLADQEQWVDFAPTVAVPYIKQRNEAERQRDGALEWLYDKENHLDAAQAELDRDNLTGIANERHLEKSYEAAMARGVSVGLLYIDLNKFKQINDTVGHQKGDDLLKFVADKLQGNIRPTDIPVRLHGDEFAVLVPDISGATTELGTREEMSDEERMDAFVSRLRSSLVESVAESDDFRSILKQGFGFSIGAVVSQPGENLEDLKERADQLMYQEKHGPRLSEKHE